MKRIVILLMVVTGIAFGQTGAVSGRVVDRRTGEPIPAVNVLLQGTLRGTATTIDGDYMFSNVAPGTYALTYSCVGYQREIRSAIEVKAGETAVINAALAAVPIQTEPVVVTASRHEQSFQDVPVSVSMLDASGIAYRNSVTIDDALRYVSGVNMTDWQVNVRGSSGYSRGAGSRVLMLVDGIPFLTGDTGELNYETVPAGQVERIEVVKGASSALYGSSALGGVINVITKRIPEDPETHVRMYGGFYNGPSYAEWDWHAGPRALDGESASISRRFGDVGLRLFLSRMADDGYRQNDYKRRYNVAVSARYDISSFDDLAMTANLLEQKRGDFIYWKDLSHALVPPDNQLGGEVHSTRFYLNSMYNHTVSSSLFYSVKAMWFRNHFSDRGPAINDNSRSDVLFGEAQATWAFAAGQILTVGASSNLDYVDSDLFGNRSGWGGALYAQDELQLTDAIRVTLGARFDIEKVDSLERTRQFNPKAAVVVTPFPGTTVRASYGRGFRSPTVAEAFTSTTAAGLEVIPNPSLQPERSDGIEIGASQLLGEAALIDVALFQTDYSNLIESGFTPQGKAQFNNVTKARIRGFEISTHLGLFSKALFVDLGYTYLYPRDLTKDDLLKYRPRHLLYASVLARAGDFTFGLDFRFISRVERIDEELVNLGIIKDGDQRVAVYVTDLRFGYDFTSIDAPLSASFNINNLFQYNYVELIGNMSPPRSYVLTLDMKL
jgi:outer membrane receptor for ferrienterochelin and colicins